MNLLLAKRIFARLLAGKAAKPLNVFERWRNRHVGRQEATIARMHSATRSAHVNLIVQSGRIASLWQVIQLGSELSQLTVEHGAHLQLEIYNRGNAALHAGQPESRAYTKEAALQESERLRIAERYDLLRQFAHAQGFEAPRLAVIGNV